MQSNLSKKINTVASVVLAALAIILIILVLVFLIIILGDAIAIQLND